MTRPEATLRAPYYRVIVRRRLECVQRAVASAPDCATLTLAGDASMGHVPPIQPHIIVYDSESADPAQTAVMRIRISRESAGVLCDSVLPRVGISTRIYEVEIASAGTILFAAYDNFYDRLAIVDQAAGDLWLPQAVTDGVVDSFSLVEEL